MAAAWWVSALIGVLFTDIQGQFVGPHRRDTGAPDHGTGRGD
ncbi:hypothetical protein OOK12_23310 [Streptomyces sp. NBC_00452]|nr:hypothetical protein [Streptomyces sp. NBC_00452]MCX5059905.1 hypothetical protein [Streptomyces sp. NBC_00452]